jgi:uncharacterized RDD family membrane protein YckC
MSARVERTVPVRSVKPEQIIVNFDAEQLKAPFLLRCGAILIDYIILIASPVVALLVGRLMEIESTKLLHSNVANTGWLIMILLALTNFVFLPLLVGQSIGKMLTGLRVVKKDGSAPSLLSLCLRHLIGYPLTALTLGLGFFLSVISPRGRALHDFIAGTVVIYGQKQIIGKESES